MGSGIAGLPLMSHQHVYASKSDGRRQALSNSVRPMSFVFKDEYSSTSLCSALRGVLFGIIQLLHHSVPAACRYLAPA